MAFDYFVGIDWSGAKGDAHRGIAVFICRPGDDVPQKIPPPNGKRAFSRGDILTLLRTLSQNKRILAGIDFAFAYPMEAQGHYFPDLKTGTQPCDAPSLWALIDTVNAAAPDFYGGLIWDHPAYGCYYNAPSGRKGAQFTSRRRATEQAASKVKSPSPTFNCVGPAGVGTGSLAGMRLCHALADEVEIWPFFDAPNANLRLVEIFPSYYFKLAGITPIKGAQAKIAALNHALAFFGTKPVDEDFQISGPDNDDADALISAAALRHLSADSAMWKVPEIAKAEGWIFGVKSDKNAP